MKKGTRLTVVSPGTQTRDFTHVEDIVDGVILASEKGLNREWHLRSGKSHSIIEVANMFNTEWQMIPERRGERLGAEDIKTDTEEVLGWQPKWNLSDYINLKIEKHADKI
jgi:UDP-glucose 4-epimerase